MQHINPIHTKFQTKRPGALWGLPGPFMAAIVFAAVGCYTSIIMGKIMGLRLVLLNK